MIRKMATDTDPTQQSIILASFENRRAAEHMLASLGRGFRKQARTGQVSAFVVSVNKDGSLKLTQARVVTTGMVEHTVIHLSVVDHRVPWADLDAARRQGLRARRPRTPVSRRIR